MPNMSGHMAIAKRVSEALNINDRDFFIGNLLPDLYVDKSISHYKTKGKKYLVPDTDLYIKEHDLTNKLNLGYLCHLLLDKYYLEEYLIDIEDNVFETKKIYKDYDILNKDIVEHFNIDADYLINILSNIDIEGIEQSKLDLNLRCLKIEEEGQTYYLPKDKFINFLEEAGEKIVKEVKKYES